MLDNELSCMVVAVLQTNHLDNIADATHMNHLTPHTQCRILVASVLLNRCRSQQAVQKNMAPYRMLLLREP